VINVNQGDTVRIKLSSLDVVHGFYLEGHGIDATIYPMKPFVRLKDPTQKEGFRDVEEVVLVAENVGKFRYRCSHTCGYLHPFMQGEFIVGPNYPFQAGVGAAIGILIAGGFLFLSRLGKP
jgi:heme/copper-type cytochrome/quinol oxidase subunit 2